MTQSLVYQYVWRDYSLPAYKGWVLTLTDPEAMVFLAFVTTLVAYTQSRTWISVRYIINKTTRPIQLRDDDDPASLRNLSQATAIRTFFRSSIISHFKSYFSRRECGQTQSFQKILRWFGALSVANILIFSALGIIISWSLTGGLETPVVRSKRLEDCVGYEDRPEMAVTTAYLADSLFKQCRHNVTESSSSCGPMNGILNNRPHLHVSREVECPFPGDVCHDDTQPLRLEYSNI